MDKQIAFNARQTIPISLQIGFEDITESKESPKVLVYCWASQKDLAGREMQIGGEKRVEIYLFDEVHIASMLVRRMLLSAKDHYIDFDLERVVSGIMEHLKLNGIPV